MLDLRRPMFHLLPLMASLFVCGTTTAQVAEAGRQIGDFGAVTIGSGVDLNPFAAEAFLLIQRSDEHWKIVSISQTPPNVTDPATQELLVVGKGFSVVEPYFRDYYSYEKKKGGDPRKPAPFDPYVCFTGEKDQRPRYNPCDSKLAYTSDRGKALLGNLMMFLEANPATLKQGTGYAVSVDKDKILALLTETDGIAAAKRFARQTRFDQADTVEKILAFMERYKNDDPDGLVPRAEAKIPDIEKTARARQLAQYRNQFQEARTSADFRVFIERYASDDPERLIPRATQRLGAAEAEVHRKSAERDEHDRKAKVAEMERQRREAANLASWRTRLKVGDDTFCGPVIEVRQPMIKIAVRAQLPGYASEIWLKTTEVFPSNVSCANRNGELLPIFN